MWDYNKGIASIKYDYLGHPVRIQFTNRNLVEYVYAADGRKLREKHTTAVEGLHMSMGQTFNLLPSQILSVDSMDYAGNIRYRWQNLHNVGDVYNYWYHFDDGYLAIMPVQTSPTAYHYIPSYHYQVRDHQGNIRVVVDEVGNLEQKNEYFAYGGPWVSSTNQGFQPFKYNNKELDRMHGLDWYDYGARRYDPAFCMFTQMDPLAEKYPHLSPYAYCAGNPVNAIDPDGRDPIYSRTWWGRIRRIGDDGLNHNRSYFVRGQVARQVKKATKRGRFYSGTLRQGNNVLYIPTGKKLDSVASSLYETELTGRENGGHYLINSQDAERWDEGPAPIREKIGDDIFEVAAITPFKVNSLDDTPNDLSSLESLWHVHPHSSSPSDDDITVLKDLHRKGFDGNAFIISVVENTVTFFNHNGVLTTMTWDEFKQMGSGL